MTKKAQWDGGRPNSRQTEDRAIRAVLQDPRMARNHTEKAAWDYPGGSFNPIVPAEVLPRTYRRMVRP